MYKNTNSDYIWAVELWVFVFVFVFILMFPKFSTMDNITFIL